MGSTKWSDDSYRSLKADYSTKTRDQIFTSKGLDKDMDPKGIKFRESRDSEAHPNSLAVAVFVDETGSMGSIPEFLIKNKLGSLMNTLIDHGVPDAHVLFGGIGDQYSDSSPLQVGQFEAGTKELDLWLTKIYLEGNGGGQTRESYPLAWLFAGRHTSIDCFEKRNEKGFLFTIGDESFHPVIEKDKLKKILGYEASEDVTAEQLLSEAQRMYHVYHLHIDTGYGERTRQPFKDLMSENVIDVADYNNVAEIIATTVAVVRGADLAKVTASFDKQIANQVTNALATVSSSITKKQDEGVLTL